MASGRSNLVDF